MRTVRRLAVIAALVVATGCGAGDADDVRGPQVADSAGPAETPATTQQPSASKRPEAAVPEALRFSSQTLDGRPFDGASLAGQKAVLWFWAPWCPNCQREAPGVGRVASTHQGEVRFVGVAAQDDVPAMREFVDDYELGLFDHLADVDAQVWRHFGVTYQPAYAFVSADGAVEVVKGGLDEGELADRVAGL